MIQHGATVRSACGYGRCAHREGPALTSAARICLLDPRRATVCFHVVENSRTHTEPFVNNDVIVMAPDGVRWMRGRDPATIPDTFQCAREKDPDNIAIGDFDPSRPGLDSRVGRRSI